MENKIEMIDEKCHLTDCADIARTSNVNGLDRTPPPKSARISRAEIKQVQSELLAWLDRHPNSISHAGRQVVYGLDVALNFGPHPATLHLLAEDVERLASAASDEDKSGR